MSSIQFTIPRVVAQEIDFPGLRRQALDRTLERTSIELSEKNAGHGRTRITTSMPMAALFAEAIRDLADRAAEKNDADLLVACAEAVKAAFDAIDDGMKHDRESAPWQKRD